MWHLRNRLAKQDINIHLWHQLYNRVNKRAATSQVHGRVCQFATSWFNPVRRLISPQQGHLVLTTAAYSQSFPPTAP